MTRKEFIAAMVIFNVSQWGADHLIEIAIEMADNMEKRGVAPWADGADVGV